MRDMGHYKAQTTLILEDYIDLQNQSFRMEKNGLNGLLEELK